MLVFGCFYGAWEGKWWINIGTVAVLLSPFSGLEGQGPSDDKQTAASVADRYLRAPERK